MFKASTFSLDTHCDPFYYLMMTIMCEWNVNTRKKLFHQILDAERHVTLQFLAGKWVGMCTQAEDGHLAHLPFSELYRIRMCS